MPIIAVLIFLLGGTAMAQTNPLDMTPAMAVRVQQDIDKYRKGEAVVTVLDRNGRPVEGASIEARQVTHDFLFGCNIYMFDHLDSPEKNARYKELFKRVMNYATLPFYWRWTEPEQGKPQYERNHTIAQWCRENGITTKGHPLVWACHDAGVPPWLPKDKPEEVWRLVEERIGEIIPQFKGEIGIWDVVNESTHGERFGEKSVVDFTGEPVRWAREVGSDAFLIVNEYGVIGDRKGHAPFYRLIKQMKADGVPLDAIGIQTHMHGGPWSLASIIETLDWYQRLELPIHLTEATILSGKETTNPAQEKLQAAYIERFYRICFSHRAVKAITWWDFSDAGAWQGVAAGLVRKDMSPKPAYLVLDDLINKQWTTVSEGRTKSDGVYAFRGFAGDYDVTVTAPSGETSTVRIHIPERESVQSEMRL